MLNPKQRDVARKILYAVETGGQVYGKQRYSDFTEAYTNSPAEHAITIGAGAWYATEAKRLLELFREVYPDKFKQLDTAGLGADLDKCNWSKYCVKKDSTKAKCIVAIISCAEGIKCQDNLMQIQIQQYENYIETTYGDMDAAALIECINIRHQGGTGALGRILAKTKKPYSVDNIYAALCTDPDDKSNNNQVGDYITRQKKVYDMIKQHVNEGSNNMGVTAQQIINTMNGWVGLSRAKGTHKKIVDLYNSHKPLARGYKVTYQDEYCDTTVSAAFIAHNAVSLIGGTECGVEKHIALFKKAGIWEEDGSKTPEIGWICCYNWDDGNQPNDGHADHIGIVSSVNKSAGTFIVTEGNMSGGVVGKRTVKVGWGYIRGFAKPKYDKAVATPTSTTGTTKTVDKVVDFNGIVTCDSLNVRTWAGVNNATVSFSPLKKGTEVAVCDTIVTNGEKWYYIKVNGKYGFAYADYITKKEIADNEFPSKSPKWDGKVTASVLNVRTWAGTENKNITSCPVLHKGDEVEVCDTVIAVDSSKWYYVRIDGYVYGFVHSAYVTKM